MSPMHTCERIVQQPGAPQLQSAARVGWLTAICPDAHAHPLPHQEPVRVGGKTGV